MSHSDNALNKMTSFEWLNSMPKEGDIVGQFKILGMLGHGGMGCVFKVYISELEAIRAIKILRPDSGKLFRERFSTEAKITANLDHPNIIRVFNVHRWRNEVPVIEMEYIDGTSLDRILKSVKKLPPPVALAIILLISGALDYAQNKEFIINGRIVKGIIHRDIKPGNILISNDGKVKVTDFGLAGFTGTGYNDDKVPLGSQIYLSPEGLRNKTLDIRSDIYSTGIVLYEMITGMRPFPETGFLGSDGIEPKLKGDYPPVDSKTTGIPRNISYIIDKCLKPDPGKRFQNFKQLYFECETALEELTSSKPEEIVENYIKNPKQFRVKLPVPARKKHKRIMTSFASLLILSLLFVMVGLFTRKHLINKTVRKPQATESGEIEMQIAGEKTAETTTVFKKNIKPRTTARKLQVTTKRKDVSQPSTEKETESILKPGIQALKEGRYDRAVSEFISVSGKAMAPKTRDSLDMYLIKTYIKKQSIRDAHILANKRIIDDGCYYLLKALIHEYAHNYREAAAAYDKAVITQSLFGDAIKIDALFKRAKFLFEHYNRTHDSVIRIKAYNACNDFIKTVCESVTTGNTRCDAALKMMNTLEGFYE